MTTPAQNEATRETVEFTHFGRTWTVPAKQRFSHLETLRETMRATGHIDLAMVHTYLDGEQVDALRGIDPDEDELGRFTDQIAIAMGFKDAGNS